MDLYSSKRLGEYVNQLFPKVDKSSGDISKLQLFSYEIIIYINILGPLMGTKNRFE